MTPIRRTCRTIGKVVVILIICFGPGGFIWFCTDALLPSSSSSENLPPHCDGIVVLTGGEYRITTALSLLEQHSSLQLLISGVSPHATLRQIIDLTRHPLPAQLFTHITLGHRAISTIGNARETAHWAQDHHLSHLMLVTSGYHMRRAILEFHELAPELNLTPYPVKPASLSLLKHYHSWRILIREYIKLIGAIIRSIIHVPQRPYDLIP